MIKKLTLLSFYGLLVWAILMRVSGLAWFLDWPQHFVAQFIIAGFIILALLLFFQKRLYAIFLALILIYFSSPLFFLMLPPAQYDSSQHPIKILQSNLNYRNDLYTQLVEVVKREQPDVITLNEVRPDMLATFHQQLPEYSSTVEQPSYTYTGVAILSKLSIKKFDAWTPTLESPPVLIAEFDNPHFTLLALHALSPESETWTRQRNITMQLLANRINELSGPIAVAGDLNLTMHSPIFSHFMNSAHMKNARQGYGWQPSWYVGSPVAIAIDHIFYRDATSSNFKVLDDVGSDHRPVMATLYFN